MTQTARKRIAGIRTALLALLLTVLAASGTAAAHSHHCQSGCLDSIGRVTPEWLQYAIDLVAVGGVLG